MIGHRTRFRENGDLPREVQLQRNSRYFLMLMTREVMRSRDAQCNTGEWLKVQLSNYIKF